MSNIISEVFNKREENVKVFRQSDGSFLAAQYTGPVHYRDEAGSWQEYDNRLEEEEASGRSLKERFLKPKHHGNSLRFSPAAREGETVRLGRGEKEITWGYMGVKASPAEYAEAPCTLHGEEPLLVCRHLHQEVLYPEVYENVDLQYQIHAGSVKENLILKTPGARQEFEAVYQTKGLKALQGDEQTVRLQSTDGQTVYVLKAPKMWDSNKVESTGLRLSVGEETESGLTLKLTADKQWLGSQERVYPVTIDPVILTKTEKGHVSTTFVNKGYPTRNYSENGEFLVGNESREYGPCRAFVKINLPALNVGDMVVDAKLRLMLCKMDMYDVDFPDLQINAHRVTSEKAFSAITWNNQPTYEAEALDYGYVGKKDYDSKVMVPKEFNITKAAKAWYEEKAPNYGILIKPKQEASSHNDTNYALFNKATFVTQYNTNYEYREAFPVMLITYRNNKGLEDYWTYSSMGAGDAGTAYVNDYTGNLVFSAPLADTTGLLMPISMSAVYNGYMMGKKNNANSYPGLGWKVNLQQTVKPSSAYGLTGESAEMFPYAWEDGDGTVHYFYKKEADGKTQYLDEDGLDLELKTVSGGGYTITDKKATVMRFDGDGYLIEIKDVNNVRCGITPLNGAIDVVTDGADHVIGTTGGTGNTVARVHTPEGKDVKLSYTKVVVENKDAYLLKGIQYPDGRSVSYTYDSDHALVSATSSYGTSLKFTYSSKARGKRVIKVEEKNGTTLGQTVSFDRSEYNTTVIRNSGADGVFGNDDDLITALQFDNYGRTVASKQKLASGTELGGAVTSYTAGVKNSTGSNIQQLNRVSGAASANKNVDNMVKNSGAEATANWASTYWLNSGSQFTVSMADDQSYMGQKSFKIVGTAVPADGGGVYYQNFTNTTLVPGKTYTLSAYVKTQSVAAANSDPVDFGACLAVRIPVSSGEALLEFSDMLTGTTDAALDNGWRRLAVAFTVPANATSGRIHLMLKNAKGTAWFDCVQVESGSAPNRYNMVENPSMELFTDNLPRAWTASNLTLGSSQDGISGTAFSGESSFQMTGASDKDKALKQSISVSGKEEDVYILSGWSKALAMPELEGRKYEMQVKVNYTDGTSKEKGPVKFSPYVEDWQYSALPFNLSSGADTAKTPKSIDISLCYFKQENKAWFDLISLVKDTSQTYSYDSKGNLISSVVNGDQKSTLSYDSESNLTQIKDAKNELYKYEYDDKHQVKKATSQRGLTANYKYDSNGNVMETEVKNSAGLSSLKTETAYTFNESLPGGGVGVKAGAYVAQKTDIEGYVTKYNNNRRNGQLNSITTPDGVVTSYTYKPNTNLIASVTKDGKTNSYAYNTSGMLTSVTHNGFKYNLSYDNFGNLSTTKVGNAILSTNTYGPNNGLLEQVEYGNGYQVKYDHNQWGQPTYIYKNGVKKYGWSYDGAGAAYTYADYENKQKSQYAYDSLGRLVRFSTRDTGKESATPQYYGEYQYDILNNVSKFAYRAGGQTITNSYTYGKDNLPETTVNSKLGTQTYYFDSLGRLDHKSPAATTGAQLKTQYYYKLSATRNTDGGSMYRSTRLNREEGNQHATSYEYDVMGNITKIYEYNIEAAKNTETVRYTYDKKNQLIREDNKLQNKSSVFAYDAGGNLTSVKEYAYTTGTLGAVLKTTAYAYDTAWKDKLVSYNGTTITYDAIGNPLSYLGRTLTWEGRQLKTLTKGSTTASYKYDAQGLRVYKKVGNEESRYFYLGGKLAYEERGTKKFWYHYDSLGALNGLTYKNGTAAEVNYSVYCNSRGDVEALYTLSGTLYARYAYDAWGNTISVTKLNGDVILPTATEIAYLNPIRYRGYYWDEESGFYYLKSRYYDPEVKRFLNPDSILFTPGLIGHNIFAYCNNNPVNMIDSGGRRPMECNGNAHVEPPPLPDNYYAGPPKVKPAGGGTSGGEAPPIYKHDKEDLYAEKTTSYPVNTPDDVQQVYRDLGKEPYEANQYLNNFFASALPGIVSWGLDILEALKNGTKDQNVTDSCGRVLYVERGYTVTQKSRVYIGSTYSATENQYTVYSKEGAIIFNDTITESYMTD